MGTRSFLGLLIVATAAACARRPEVDAGPPGPWVTSDPTGLEIVLDGQSLGRKTPSRIESWEPLLPHEIVLEAPGRVPFRQEIPAGDPPAQVDAKLPVAALLDAESEPAGATVAILGQVVLTPTPTTLSIPAAVPVQVTLSLAGYLPDTATVTVPAGETVHLVRKLRRGQLVDLQSDPQGATVELDGEKAGKAPLQLPVEVGRTHVARMLLPGLLPCERRFEVKPSQPQTVTCALDDARARSLRARLQATQLSLKMAQRQLEALDDDHPDQIGQALAVEKRRGKLQDAIDRLSDEADQQQGDLEAHRTALEERFEAPH
ncbi:MAG TPA: PEGA domain-containing protein [Myxococcales bacterium]|nr:PEGA domain-containing protein [Myxococcales bacterium]